MLYDFFYDLKKNQVDQVSVLYNRQQSMLQPVDIFYKRSGLFSSPEAQVRFLVRFLNGQLSV